MKNFSGFILTFLTLVFVPGSALGAQSDSPIRPDKTFSEDGVFSMPPTRSYSSNGSIGEAPGEKTVLGLRGMNSRVSAVLRLTKHGLRDRSLSGDGIAPLKFGPAGISPNDILVDRKGRILVTGTSRSKQGFRGGVARLTESGIPDQSFGQKGITLPAFAKSGTPNEMAFAPGGKIVIAGIIGGIPARKVFVGRFLPNGKLDRTFSGKGWRILSTLPAQARVSVAVDKRGRVVIGNGTLSHPKDSFTWAYRVSRLTPSGSLDSTFSGDGKVVVDPNPEVDRDSFADLTIDRKDRILAVGVGYEGSDIARLRANGTLDPKFSDDGLASLPMNEVSSVSEDSRGRVITIGTNVADNVENWPYPPFLTFAVAARFNSNGDPDFVLRTCAKEAGLESPGSLDFCPKVLIGFSDHYLDQKSRIVIAPTSHSRVSATRLLNR